MRDSDISVDIWTCDRCKVDNLCISGRVDITLCRDFKIRRGFKMAIIDGMIISSTVHVKRIIDWIRRFLLQRCFNKYRRWTFANLLIDNVFGFCRCIKSFSYVSSMGGFKNCVQILDVSNAISILICNDFYPCIFSFILGSFKLMVKNTESVSPQMYSALD